MSNNEQHSKEESRVKSQETIQSKCPSCGGLLVYAPETLKLECAYCRSEVELDLTPAEIEENCYEEHVQNPTLHTTHETMIAEVACAQCGAHTTFPENTTSFTCAFCGTPIVLKEEVHKRSWTPEYILPFRIGKQQAKSSFTKWVKGLWLAPSKLSAQLSLESALKGVYLPYWTYDSNTTTRYIGERGINRQVAVRVNGKTQYRTVTDWRNVSGVVEVEFDDVLTPASNSLPPNIAKVLTNWDRHNYVQYNNVYLRGFLSELYQHNFIECLPEAKKQMEDYIRIKVREDIGGHQQRINQCEIEYADIKFKHVLLPVWISAYRYKGKSYIFAINGRTGEVKGEYPWSTVKVIGLIIVLLAILGCLFYYF